jgi:hypothetical protein
MLSLLVVPEKPIDFSFNPPVGTVLECSIKSTDISNPKKPAVSSAVYRLQVKDPLKGKIHLVMNLISPKPTDGGTSSTIFENLFTRYGIPGQFLVADGVWNAEEFWSMPLPAAKMIKGQTLSYKTNIEFVTISGKATFLGYKERKGRLLPEITTSFSFVSGEPDLIEDRKVSAVYLYDPRLKCIVHARSSITINDIDTEPPIYLRIKTEFDAKEVSSPPRVGVKS